MTAHIARYLAQLAGTLIIVAWIPSNAGRAALLLAWWALTFWRVSRAELVLFLVACCFFTAMNAASLAQGIFRFSNPDVLGMPYYELVMWGFYLLHVLRLVEGPAPAPHKAAWVLAALYAAAFALSPDTDVLLAVTATLLLGALVLFHEPYDLGYTFYMVSLGAAVEYTGVHSGEWSYPESPAGGVPVWFVTLWGGVGLFLRRLVLPVLARHRAPSGS